jgi:RNA-directed DNA polymerase
MKTTIEELAPYMRGWRSYFGFCETPEVLIGLDTLGPSATQGCFVAAVENIAPSHCWNWGPVHGWPVIRLEAGAVPGISHGPRPWSVGLSNEYFKSLGLPSLFEEASA